MKEIIFTSSVLIVALLLLRACFRGGISRRMQYALWLVVAARLLLPVSLPGFSFSLLSTTQQAQTFLDESLTTRQVYVLPVDGGQLSDYNHTEGLKPGDRVPDASSFGYPVLNRDGQTVTRYADRVPLSQVLLWTWYGGMALVGGCFLLTNFRFSRKLRQVRTLHSVPGCPLPVYLVEQLPSPCLFGLLRPAVYLTPAAAADEARLRHVLAHELSHHAHFDHLWAILRCLCLTVHWFNPLVWLAAIVSKADCELACDEAALARLGAAERLSYGQTLLSLIPIRKSPVNPLLSATTMTAGKRQLTDRIRRIAENRKTVATALALALTLVTLVCACTFTGAKAGSATLTPAQLAYFNETYFNDLGQPLRNQFLTSYYEKPEDIDLHQLLYNGIGPDAVLSEAENTALSQRGLPLIYDTAKITTADLNAILLDYTGLTLEKSNQISLEQLHYFPEFDAYYQIRSDSNYPLDLQFTAGGRQGDLISLYYPNAEIQGTWFCLTLRDLGQEQYHFVSHLPSDGPHLPPVTMGEPDLLIPLSAQEPYTAPPAVNVLDNVSATDETTFYYATIGEDPETQYSVAVYRQDSQVHMGYRFRPAINSDSRFTRAVTLSLDVWNDAVSVRVLPFENLFGQSGFVFSYNGLVDFDGRSRNTQINEYIYFPKDTTPAVRLAQIYGNSQILDINGDGENELVSNGLTAQLFYRKDGQIYNAPIVETLQQAWPEASYVSPIVWKNGSLFIQGYVSDYHTSADRTLTFTGDALELRRDKRATTDHVVEGVDAPPDVLAAAKVFVQSQYELAQKSSPQNVQVNGNGEIQQLANAYDDWRIEYLDRASAFVHAQYDYVQPQTYDDFYGLNLEFYRMNYEFHTPTPEAAVLAGGAYVTEDGWYAGGYPNCTYLFFQVKDGQRVFLYSAMINDSIPGTELFDNDLKERLIQLGLIQPDSLPLTREGLTETIPVREFMGIGFRISIPREGWREDNIPVPADNHKISQWTSTVNAAARLTIHCRQHKDQAFARESVFLDYPGFVFEKTEAADREILYGYNKSTGMTLALFTTEGLYGSNGSTQAYSIAWQYPSETEEGFGALLRAMAESFQPDRPLTP